MQASPVANVSWNSSWLHSSYRLTMGLPQLEETIASVMS